MYDYDNNSDWKWRSVLSPNCSEEKDEGPDIYYFVLFVSRYAGPDDIWKIICELTERSKLGYRAAIAPNFMTEGEYAEHTTITVETPLKNRKKVFERLERHGLRKHLRYWKVRTRYDYVDEDGIKHRAGSEILKKY